MSFRLDFGGGNPRLSCTFTSEHFDDFWSYYVELGSQVDTRFQKDEWNSHKAEYVHNIITSEALRDCDECMVVIHDRDRSYVQFYVYPRTHYNNMAACTFCSIWDMVNDDDLDCNNNCETDLHCYE